MDAAGWGTIIIIMSIMKMEGMRMDIGGRGLDLEELIACAGNYGRPSVRWLLRYAQKNQLTRS